MPKPGQPSDDPSSAPESGTVRDAARANPVDRPATDTGADPTRQTGAGAKDAPWQATEER